MSNGKVCFQMFERVRRDCPEQLAKMKMVPGDIAQANLGIQVEDLERLKVTTVANGPSIPLSIQCL